MTDAFDLLGLPATFDLPAGRVREAYLARVQMQERGGAEERRETRSGEEGVKAPSSARSEQRAPSPPERGEGGNERAAALNAAKMTLLDPESRANLLLARLGGPSKDVSRELPDGFLMRMMEVREELEAAASRRDGAAIERWREWAEREREGHAARVGELFRSFEAARDGKLLTAVRKELNAWRYVERMVEQIEAL